MAERIGGVAGRAAKAISDPLDKAQMAARKLTGDTDATKMLTADHRKVKLLFAAFKASGDHAIREKEELFEQIDQELTVHTKLEEEIFYPAVKALRGEESLLVAEAHEEHAIVKKLLGELRKLPAGSEEFQAKMKVMMESVLHHASEEERSMFPAAKKGLKDRVDSLGREMEQRKHELLGRMETRKAG